MESSVHEIYVSNLGMMVAFVSVSRNQIVWAADHF